MMAYTYSMNAVLAVKDIHPLLGARVAEQRHTT